MLTALLPFVFALLWASSYVAAKVGLVDATPFALVGARLSIAAFAAALLITVTGRPWPGQKSWPFLLLGGALLVAFIPAVVLGLALGDDIELLLGNAVVVAWALIVGGVAILIIERLARTTDKGGVQNVTLMHSIGIGLVQCLAMIPGVSRSGATILGAMSMGVDRKTAAEFSFFLAVPTLSGATALQLYKHGATMQPGMGGWILLGSLVSFVVAVVVVKAFVSIIQRYGFAPFAWYRIAAGTAALAWLAMR